MPTATAEVAVPPPASAASSAHLPAMAPSASPAPPDARERDKPLSTPHSEAPGWLRVHGAALGATSPEGARTIADPAWVAHVAAAVERALTGVPTYRPRIEPALATTLALRVAPDGTVSDVRVVAPSGTLLDLVAADALAAPFPARSASPEQLVVVVECRGSAWPETRGVTVAVAGERPCRVSSVARIGDGGTTPSKVRPRSAP